MSDVGYFIEMLDKSGISDVEFCKSSRCHRATLFRWRETGRADADKVSYAINRLRKMLEDRLVLYAKLLEEYPAFEGEN